ncbi:MAG: hypothetical protein ACLVEF_07225 [Bifidobacterium bifidum]
MTVTVPAQTENGGGHDVQYLKNYLSEQGMENVTVADEYLQNAGKKEVEYLLSFEPDRLLVEFRAQAGLDTKGAKNYGGWENGPDESRNLTAAANRDASPVTSWVTGFPRPRRRSAPPLPRLIRRPSSPQTSLL